MLYKPKIIQNLRTETGFKWKNEKVESLTATIQAMYPGFSR